MAWSVTFLDSAKSCRPACPSLHPVFMIAVALRVPTGWVLLNRFDDLAQTFQ